MTRGKVAAALGRCDYAGCRNHGVTTDQGFVFCGPCYHEHLALLRAEAQRVCGCGQTFVSTNPRRVLCSNCQRASRRAS